MIGLYSSTHFKVALGRKQYGKSFRYDAVAKEIFVARSADINVVGKLRSNRMLDACCVQHLAPGHHAHGPILCVDAMNHFIKRH